MKRKGLTVRRTTGGVPGRPRPEGVVKVVCDLEPRGFEGLEPDPEKLLPMVTTSRGEVSLRAAYPSLDTIYLATDC